MVELWRDEAVERAWSVLQTLREITNFVLIGGWGVYFWTRKLRSRDIDMCLDQASFYSLQAEAMKRGLLLKRNPRLRKFEALINGVEVDMYTPFMSRLVVPCEEILREDMNSNIERFRVAIPEVLLLLKAQAVSERWSSEKGMKDRIDIISLLSFADMKPEILKKLLKKYDAERKLLEVLQRTLAESRREYRHLGMSYEKDGVRLRRTLWFLAE